VIASVRRIALVIVLSLSSTRALAHGGGPRPLEGSLAELPAGPIKRALSDARAAAAKAEIDPAILEGPTREALRAMERAKGASAAGDVRHAAMLEKLAAEWSKVATLLVRAATGENAAQRAAAATRDQSGKVERARALLGEQQARRGRLQAQVAMAEARVARAQADNAEREKSRVAQPGKAKPAKPQKGGGK
jgi:hypothetical protein